MENFEGRRYVRVIRENVIVTTDRTRGFRVWSNSERLPTDTPSNAGVVFGFHILPGNTSVLHARRVPVSRAADGSTFLPFERNNPNHSYLSYVERPAPSTVPPRLAATSRFPRAGLRNTPRDAMRPLRLNYKKDDQSPGLSRHSSKSGRIGKRKKERKKKGEEEIRRNVKSNRGGRCVPRN